MMEGDRGLAAIAAPIGSGMYIYIYIYRYIYVIYIYIVLCPAAE